MTDPHEDPAARLKNLLERYYAGEQNTIKEIWEAIAAEAIIVAKARTIRRGRLQIYLGEDDFRGAAQYKLVAALSKNRVSPEDPGAFHHLRGIVQNACTDLFRAETALKRQAVNLDAPYAGHHEGDSSATTRTRGLFGREQDPAEMVADKKWKGLLQKELGAITDPGKDALLAYEDGRTQEGMGDNNGSSRTEKEGDQKLDRAEQMAAAMRRSRARTRLRGNGRLQNLYAQTVHDGGNGHGRN